MNQPAESPNPFSGDDTLWPQRVRLFRRIDSILQFVGVVAVVVQYGLYRNTQLRDLQIGLVVIAVMIWLSTSLCLRYAWSVARPTFLRKNRALVVLTAIWMSGVLGIILFGGSLPVDVSKSWALLAFSELLLVLQGVLRVVTGTRGIASSGANPAGILVISFFVLVLVGTLLLMLPRARHNTGESGDHLGAPLLVALFTATSAGCVTGLTVVPTGSYWSPLGQTIILCLFQIGGLGIMTCGAFFAVLAGRHMPIRESATLRDMLESERLGDVRRLVLTILVFTFLSELAGAVLLSGLWSDFPSHKQTFYSVFHSVSAFCNAGFSLTENSVVGLGTRWQVWGAMSGLIIVGGLGFAVLYNLALTVLSRFRSLRRQPLYSLPQTRVRLNLTSKLVLITTSTLLVAGAVGYLLLESTVPASEQTTGEQIAEAWFQSVTFRTAGFNSVDHGQLQPATKLLAVLMMFVGASPGSTGGGVKTICFALSVLALGAVLHGRQRVEIFGRTIPDVLVNRALVIMSLGMFVVMVTTMLLMLFEYQPGHPDRFLDHLFEATSAFATVGVSTGLTPDLTTPSKLVIVVAMFLGRVGPLTLLIALAGRMREVRYDYPNERVTLG